MSTILGTPKNFPSSSSHRPHPNRNKFPKLSSYGHRNNRNKSSYEKTFFSYNVVPILSYKLATAGFYLHPSLPRRQPIPATTSDRWNSPLIPASEHPAKLLQIRQSEQLLPQNPTWGSPPLPSKLQPSAIWDFPGCPRWNTPPKLLQIRQSEQVFPQRHRPSPASSPFQLRLPATRNALTCTYRNKPQICPRYKDRNNAWRSSLLPLREGLGGHGCPIEQVPAPLVRDSYNATHLESAS